jgi:hypothetical protein
LARLPLARLEIAAAKAKATGMNVHRTPDDGLILFRSKDRNKRKAEDSPNSVPKRAERNQSDCSGEWRETAAKKASCTWTQGPPVFLPFLTAFFVCYPQ